MTSRAAGLTITELRLDATSVTILTSGTPAPGARDHDAEIVKNLEALFGTDDEPILPRR